MADTPISEMLLIAGPVPKKGRTKKAALKQKNQSSSEANILAGASAQPSPTPVEQSPDDSAGKENHESLSQPPSQKKTTRGAAKSKKQSKQSFEREFEEMQEKFQQLKLEKEQTEELLKARDELLKLKEEDLEARGKEQEKLQMELKKLQKMKEFKPTMIFPVQSLKDKEQDKKEKKKKGCPEKKRPSPPYVLWCKDQWNEVKKANPDAEFKEISNILGVKWKTVGAEEKKPYEERYRAEKEVYLKIIGKEKRENEAMRLLEEDQKQRTAMELLEQYIQFKQEAEKEHKKKKEKDPLKPKHPMSAFFLFTSHRRAALLAENKNIMEISKITGEEWKNMSEKQKAPYVEMAKKNKEQYTQDMELYKQKKDEEAVNLGREEEELMKLQKHEALQLLKKKEKTENIIKKTKENRQKKQQQKEEKKNADPNKPKRPASSFILFRSESLECIILG
ncbi:unnamed protein product [Ilex paraguariensis]|uniref:HMG box domain-containing protein n=1 Tax=Ilex paraguariensis TaxID=185542 RepID=A0ABC8RDZ6_9AQUA